MLSVRWAKRRRECILALAAEPEGNRVAANRTGCALPGLLSTPEEAPLQAALILRHLFDLIVGDEDAADYDDECTTWLERSLELDPDDRATHLKLIRLHRQGQDLKAARASVETALARFANDPAVLLEAVETALAGNAFKKAVTLAKRLLDLDPINSKVRALIGQAHLSHARKQIRAAGDRRRRARNSTRPSEWLASASERSVSKLLRGLSATDVRRPRCCGKPWPNSEAICSPPSTSCSKVSRGQPASRSPCCVGPASNCREARAREVLAVMHAINALGENERRHWDRPRHPAGAA
jgi:tetratricopeptide (TPR) repeat protein